MPGSFKWSPSIGLLHQNPACTYSLPIRTTCPAHLCLLVLRLYRRITRIRGFCDCFVARLSFYGEALLAHRPTPQLEDHPLSAVCDCLFDIIAATNFILLELSRHRLLRVRKTYHYHLLPKSHIFTIHYHLSTTRNSCS
jgi:hypothetical protein